MLKVIEYCTKYVTKSELRSQSLRDVYTIIVHSLMEGNHSLKAVQKCRRYIINSVGERDYSAQETCHLLLHLTLMNTSRDFIVVNLDGSSAIEDHLQENERATTPLFLEVRPTKPQFKDINLLQFCQQYTMPKVLGSVPNRRGKSVIVVICPYYPSDPASPQYEQYCQISLTKHKAFHQINELLAGKDT